MSLFTVNYKVLVNFTYFNFGETSSTGYSKKILFSTLSCKEKCYRYCTKNKLTLELGEYGEKINLCGNYRSALNFVSYANALKLKTISETGWKPGHGFKAKYSIGNYG